MRSLISLRRVTVKEETEALKISKSLFNYWSPHIVGDLDKVTLLLDSVISQYLDPKRHYHSILHISSMWDTYKQFFPELYKDTEISRKVLTAIVFHDAIYIQGAPNNEYLSSLLLSEFLDLTDMRDEDIVEAVLTTSLDYTPITFLGRLLRDLDFSVFSYITTHRKRMQVLRLLRNELSSIKENLFYKGRLAFLESLPKELYYLDEFKVLNSLARDNIELTIDYLKVKINNSSSERM